MQGAHQVISRTRDPTKMATIMPSSLSSSSRSISSLLPPLRAYKSGNSGGITRTGATDDRGLLPAPCWDSRVLAPRAEEGNDDIDDKEINANWLPCNPGSSRENHCQARLIISFSLLARAMRCCSRALFS